jgi:hypothetical protein
MGDARSFFNSLPVAGGLFESLWGSPEQEAKQKAMAEAQQAMFAYRPVAMDARLGAMNNMSAAFGPMQQLMGQMYGPAAQTDMSKLIGNPFSEQAQAEMLAKAQGPGPGRTTPMPAPTDSTGRALNRPPRGQY